MKSISLLLLILMATTRMLAANEASVSTNTNATPHASRETFEAKVLKVYMAKDGNAESRAYVVTWKGQEVIVPDQMGQSDYREGDKIRVVVLKSERPVGRTAHGFLMFGVTPVIPEMKPQIKVGQAPAHHLVFFECRGNELFCIEKDALDDKVAKALGGNPQQNNMAPKDIVVAMQGKVIGNASYTVDPTFLSMGLLRLNPRVDVQGERAAELARPKSKFQMALRALDPKKDSIVFFVRGDSADVCDKARQIAEAAGFSTMARPLDNDKPITIGH